MKTIVVKEDVRFLGVGYSPGDEPIEVSDEVAGELVKIGCAEIVEGEAAGGGYEAGSANTSGAGTKE